MKYLIDLDGTLLNGDYSINSSVEFISELQKRNSDFLVMTNSIKSPQLIKDRLSKVGIDILSKQILTPIIAINEYLTSEHIQRAYIIGSQLEVEQVTISHNSSNPQIIVLLDFEKENITYNDLQNVFMLIQHKIPIIAASGSAYYIKNSVKYLDTGAFVSLFEKASNVSIPIMGKPSKEYFSAGISLLRAKPENITVIGDDWMTDIQGAKNCGCKSILLQSGKYENGDENRVFPSKTITNLLEAFEINY